MKILVIGKYNPLDSTNPIILIKIGLLQTLSESYWEFSLKKKNIQIPSQLLSWSTVPLDTINHHTVYRLFTSFFNFQTSLAVSPCLEATGSLSLSFSRPTSCSFLVSAPFLRWDDQNEEVFPLGRKIPLTNILFLKFHIFK